MKARQARCGSASPAAGAHKRNRRPLSGLLVCGYCGSKMVLRGANTYACSAHQNRGEAVCSSRVTVNARAAERRLLSLVRAMLYGPRRLKQAIQKVRRRLSAAERLHKDRGK